MATCLWPDCPLPPKSRGICSAHYTNVLKLREKYPELTWEKLIADGLATDINKKPRKSPMRDLLIARGIITKKE